MGDGFGIALVWGVSELVSDLVRGNRLLRSGKPEEAVAAFQKAIAHHPYFHWSHYKLGESLAALGRWEEAVDAYKKAVKYNPELYLAYQKLGETLNQLDCWEEAVRCFRKAIDFNPKAVEPNPDLYWAYQYLGETLHHLWRWEKAVTAFRQAIAINPTAKWSYFYLGQVLAHQKEWSEAIASYQKAIALNLTEPQVFWGLGRALEALKHWDEAIATYQKTIELNANQYQSYQYLGNLLLRQRQWTEAVAAHEKAVQLNPKSSGSQQNLGRALYYLGKSLAEQNLWSEAVEHYRQALDLGFDQGPLHYDLGKGLNQLGCYEEAVVELKRALEFNPLFLEWEQELEYALNKLGRTLATESTTDEATQVPYGVIARSQQTWRNYVTNNLQDISQADAEVLQSLPPAAIERYIYGKPEAVYVDDDEAVLTGDKIKLAINYLDSSDGERSCLENFLDFTRSQDFCSNLVASILKNGFCQIPNPLGEGYAICKESFHIGGFTLLRFVNPNRETFMVISWVNSGDLIYFPVLNIFLRNSHITEVLLKKIIRVFIENFTDNLNYTIQHNNNKFGGIISSHSRPAHFYYEVCFGLYHLYKKGLLAQVPLVYKYRGGNFFPISSLFHLDESREIEIEDLTLISDKTRSNCEFYIHIGSSVGNYNGREHLWNREELSEMIVSKASELVDDETAEEVKGARECYPLLWCSTPTEHRSWIDQVEGYAKIITELANIYPHLGVVFDGWTAVLNPTQRDINEAAKDQAVVNEIVQLLPPSVQTFTVVGSTVIRKLAFATVIDTFIANKGTGSIPPDNFAKRTGILHHSNRMRLAASRIYLHYNVVNVPSNHVADVPNPKSRDLRQTNYSINPDVILNLVKEILTQSNL